jgi:hypothetical protein
VKKIKKMFVLKKYILGYEQAFNGGKIPALLFFILLFYFFNFQIESNAVDAYWLAGMLKI